MIEKEGECLFLYGVITYKLVLVFVLLWAFVRISGKKKLAQLTALDFIHLFMLTSILSNYLDMSKSVLGLLYAVSLWAVLVYILELCSRKRVARKLIQGETSRLIIDGDINVKEFKKNNLEMEQFRTLMREQGVYSLHKVQHAFLETDGSLTVVKIDDPNINALLVDNGEIIEQQLQRIDKTKEWLIKELNHRGYDNVKKLFCVEWSKEEGFYIKRSK
ncbi:DUF421 domain-containing protein [Niallia sp. 03133]|uniref:DUF421 domain-containing protein n=1 Tax=Niallia sp. 03133 TaxID=3458060 RepID=UPI004043B980